MSVRARVEGGVVVYRDTVTGQIVPTATARTTIATEAPQAVNRRVLVERARTALATNATYLAIGAPTAAQNLAQIRALTRETSALIRLLVRQLDTTNGT